MAIYTELLACKAISDDARAELARAHSQIHKEIPGIDKDIEIVELQHAGEGDRSGMYVWGVPREVQIESRGLFLNYQWSDEYNGYLLSVLSEGPRAVVEVVEDEGLGDLDDHPF